MPVKGFDAPVLTPVRSSNVKAVGYDPDNQMLYIEYLDKDKFGHVNKNMPGVLYRYFDVAKNVFNRLMAATSKGEFV